ncbi:Glucan endo-1,3-beta-glucosidase A1 [Colletotrichum siamense]|uniref:Glucan endo-1,3-beta-glucosidase A1 n=1 Tax=Colletotrichum siamense TaxID=690259 RepID=UPI00187263E9|nr:Glucan endo-1,3-beta-glucosidase A1 [Colletotrichum siamense]KAF5494737.1 Glucan endo-1,3-beta-glucosidase A1 [Colletotrichum siamense]
MDTLPLEIITTISEHLEPSDFTAFESVNRALRHSIEQILADATVYTDEDEYASLEARYDRSRRRACLEFLVVHIRLPEILNDHDNEAEFEYKASKNNEAFTNKMLYLMRLLHSWEQELESSIHLVVHVTAPGIPADFDGRAWDCNGVPNWMRDPREVKCFPTRGQSLKFSGRPKTDRAMRTFDLTAAILLALPVAHAQVPDIAGFSKTWFDDFTGSRGALPSSGNWIIDTGTSYPGGPANWGTGEVQTYTNSPSNVATNGQGNLVITAIKDAKGAWTSARIETKQTFMAPAGKKMRVQASLKLPNLGGGGVGYWPAFWTLGAAYRGNYWNWPSVGEIDIMENVNNVNRVWAVLHCGTNPGGPCNEPSGLGNSKNCPATSSCSGVFRTYAVEVDRTKSPEAIRWYVNDQLLHSVTQTQLPAAVWANTTQKAHFVLLNMAMGGSFPDAIYGSKTPIATTVSGGTLEAQYVAVYYSK